MLGSRPLESRLTKAPDPPKPQLQKHLLSFGRIVWAGVAAVVGGAIVAWLKSDSGSLVKATVDWLAAPAQTNHGILLLCAAIIVAHAGIGLLAMARHLRKEKATTKSFTIAVVKNGLWSFSFWQGDFASRALCPFDKAELQRLMPDNALQIDTAKLRKFTDMRCPLCEKKFRCTFESHENLKSIVSGWLSTDEWKRQMREHSSNLAALRARITGAVWDISL